MQTFLIDQSSYRHGRPPTSGEYAEAYLWLVKTVAARGFLRITLRCFGEIGKFLLLFKLKSGLIFCWLYRFILEPALCKRLWLSDKCVNSELRYYYDSNLKRCQPFKFGNCLGNENIHPTEVDCHPKCAGLYHCLVFSRRMILRWVVLKLG